MSATKHPRALAQAYLVYRRSLGFQLNYDEKALLNFVEFADHWKHRGPLTVELAVRWAKLPEDASGCYQARRLAVVRGFARYCAVFDPKTQVPPRGLVGSVYRRGKPYIYSPKQIEELVHAATKLGPKGSLRPRTYTTLLGLLACTGLRISEAMNLRWQDVDLEQGVLQIRQTKFRKSRLVPLHPSVVGPLRLYVRCRRTQGLGGCSANFFIGSTGRPLAYSTVSATFRGICRRLGWHDCPGQHGPRIHDLRHTFAVRCLLGWYEQGVNVAHAVAALSTYLGHGKVTDTYWYLTSTSELMAMAARGFERFAATDQEGGSDESQ